MSTLNYWYSNVDYKQRSLTDIFGVCLVFATISSMFIVAFGTLTLEDVAFVPLLLLTLVAAFPYVEVAVKANSSSTSPRVLTAASYKKHIFSRSSKYTILTSRLGVFQPMYAAFCIISFLLISINKILGEEMISKKTVAGFLIMQVPFNPLFGFNPIPVRLMRMPESRFVTQNNIFDSMPSYEPKRFSPQVRGEQDIMNTSTRIQIANKPKQLEQSNTLSNKQEASSKQANNSRNRNKEIFSMLKNL